MQNYCCHLMFADIYNRAEKSLACCEKVDDKMCFSEEPFMYSQLLAVDG